MRGGLSFSRVIVLAFGPFLLLNGGTTSWLDRVTPVITPAEKKLYLSLSPEERRGFEDNFWSSRAIAPEEYFARLQTVDVQFGSTRAGSGVNTDQGRVYLALGPPVRIARIPSSRVFVPLEIWHYDAVPGVLNTELRLIFFTKNNTGWPKLYSPTLDTVSALLLPQSSARGMFGPNASLNESDIRKVLKVGPAEDEVISAAVNVATGIRYSGNDEILRQVTSPAAMLSKSQRTEVKSRLLVARPKLDTMVAASKYGGSQVDFKLETAAQHELDIEVATGQTTVYQHRLRFSTAPGTLVYQHRLDLLPGPYRVLFSVDGTVYPYLVDIPERTATGEIVRADQTVEPVTSQKPFQFDGTRLDLNPDGRIAAVALARSGPVAWTIRKGTRTVWKSITTGGQIAWVELPTSGLEPGTYKLEAATEEDTRTVEWSSRGTTKTGAPAAVVSFNANLTGALRFAFVGRQWLLRRNLDAARQSLRASLADGATDEAQIELARADALTGRLDEAGIA